MLASPRSTSCPPSNIGLKKSSGQPPLRRTKVRSRPKILSISQSRASFSCQHSEAVSHNRLITSVCYSTYQNQPQTIMPGATKDSAPVQIVDPTSETGEEIDPAVDRDRIRVVCQNETMKSVNPRLTSRVAFWFHRNSSIFPV